MIDETVSRSVSIFFYAGDFVDVLRRHAAGEQQVYATHGEVARLILDLRSADVKVTIYSYVTDTANEETPIDGVRVISLGANSETRGILRTAVERDESDTIIAHFAFPELLTAALKSGKRVFAALANSYNSPGLRQYLRRKRIAFYLNDKRIRMVTNHCVPATEHLAKIGVARRKLVPWDVPHRFDPKDFAPKEFASKRVYDIAYAGSIAELKGVGDLIRAIALLKDRGVQLRASLAGLGDIQQMQQLADSLGVGDRVNFCGIIGNDDVFQIFRYADIVVVPSHAAYPEGFPLTMFEAIASRSPIVCTDHPMFRPIMFDGDNCAVFASGDADEFAAATQRVLENPALYSKLSKSAEITWERLKGPADWRTLMTKWITEGEASDWVARHKLMARPLSFASKRGGSTLPGSVKATYTDCDAQ